MTRWNGLPYTGPKILLHEMYAFIGFQSLCEEHMPLEGSKEFQLWSHKWALSNGPVWRTPGHSRVVCTYAKAVSLQIFMQGTGGDTLALSGI